MIADYEVMTRQSLFEGRFDNSARLRSGDCKGHSM